MVPLVSRSLSLWALSLGLLLALPGCSSDECTAACRHLIDDCGIDRPDYSVEDCSSGCTKYVQHYEDEWQASESRRAVRCVANASCTDLREGMPCFDEAVYVW